MKKTILVVFVFLFGMSYSEGISNLDSNETDESQKESIVERMLNIDYDKVENFKNVSVALSAFIANKEFDLDSKPEEILRAVYYPKSVMINRAYLYEYYRERMNKNNNTTIDFTIEELKEFNSIIEESELNTLYMVYKDEITDNERIISYSLVGKSLERLKSKAKKFSTYSEMNDKLREAIKEEKPTQYKRNYYFKLTKKDNKWTYEPMDVYASTSGALSSILIGGKARINPVLLYYKY